MKTKIITIVLLLMVAVGVVPEGVLALSDSEVVASVNIARSERGLDQYSVGVKLEKAAHAKLRDIQQYKYWGHNNPVTGEPWWRNIYKAGVRGKAAENLARGYQEGAQVVSGWDASPLHQVNLFSKVYRKIGVAVGEVKYPEGKKIVVVAEYGE